MMCKKNVVIVILLLACSLLFASTGFQVDYSSKSASEIQLNFELDDYSIDGVVKDGVNYSKIKFDGSVVTNDKGFAELPFINANIQISTDKNVDLEIIGYDYKEYTLDFPLLPSRGTIYRNQNPDEIPYEISPKSIVDSWYPGELAYTTEPFILRDVRGTNVRVQPFQYNAVTKVLRVYESVKVVVKDNNEISTNPLSVQNPTVSPEMVDLYNTVFINFNDNQRYANQIGQNGELLVIYTSRDASVIQPYITWKREKGFIVHTQQVSAGTNVKTNILNAYNSNNNILYVQLVGDWADIKSDLGTSGNAPMDPKMGCVVGTDNYPDVIIGRFSASATTHVTTQVNKTINYEKNPDVGGTWYKNALGMARNEGAGSGDDSEGDDLHMERIRDYRLLPYNYSTVYQEYDGGSSYVGSNTTSTIVSNRINSGVSILNYINHGNETGWSVASYSNSHVNNLTNGNKLPFIWSVACLVGKFSYTSGDCFAETWLKKENGGAVAFLGSTINQPWTPPMRGQDYFNDLIIGGYNYSSNPGNGTTTTASDKRTTFGSIAFNGMVLMYSESSGTDDLETIQTWTIFGDASLQIRTDTPKTVSLSNSTVMIGTAFTTTVTTGGSAVEGALVSLYQDGNTYSGYTNASGSVTINHSLTAEAAKLVVTGYNLLTKYDDITVTSSSGPYVVIDGYTISAGGNSTIEYGETVYLTVTLKNMGTSTASSTNMTISESDAYVTLNDSSESFGNIAAGASVTRTSAFQWTMSNNVPDEHNFTINSSITCTGDSWTPSMSFIAYRPDINVSQVAINDGDNGRLDPGETADVIVTLENAGGAQANSINAVLSSADSYITINDNNDTLAQLAAGGTNTVTFNITVSGSAPVGHSALFNVGITAHNGYSNSDSFSQTIGLNLEDFESGDFSSYAWSHSGDGNWTISTTLPYEGSYAAKSGTITHSQTSSLVLTADVSAAGDISFYKKVSSESGYDFLRFYIDDVQQGQWAGTVAWSQETYSVAAGTHTFRWTYSKDSSVSSSDDSAWIDYIVFPSFGASAPSFSVSPTSLAYGNVYVGQNATQSFTITNSGGAALSGNIATPLGYSITARSNRMEKSKTRATISYNIGANSSQTFNITFAPAAATSYNGNITITSNDSNHPTNYVAVSGAGINPPTAVITPASFTPTLQPDATGSEALNISNTGGANLTYEADFIYVTRSRETIMSEDFNTSTNLPSGWQIIDNQGNGQVWQFGTVSGGLSGTTGNYAFLNSDGYGSGNSQNSDLITPTLDFSNYSDITIAFTHYFRSYLSSSGTFSYSINGGSTWTQIQQWTGSSTTNPTNFSQIISAVAGQSNVKFKWNYTGTWGYYWCFDDLVISGESAGPSYTWLSLNGQPSVSGTVTPGNNTNIPVNFDAAGLALGAYEAQINITTNDTGNSSVTIPVTLTVSQETIDPGYSATPTSLAFSNVTVNTTSNLTFTITNTGGSTLMGNITTPYNQYVVSEQSKSADVLVKKERNERNTISYSIADGSSKTFNIAFTPTTVTTYNGNISITSNDPAHQNNTISVTGSGTAAPVPDINVTPATISKTMETNQTGTENLQISNTGTASLDYSASVQYNSKSRDVIFNDGFETYTDFALNFTPWTMHDVDVLATYGSSDCDFTNEQYTGAFIMFNPSQTTADATSGNNIWTDDRFQPRTGNKYAACFNNATAGTPNNDWLITPQISLQSASQLSFWAKSVKDDWGLEQFKVGISTTGANTTDFTIISGASSISAPATWTQFTYDISAYDGMDVYVAIQAVTDDCFVLAIDDVSVTGTPVSTENWLALNGQPSVSGTIAAGNNNSIAVNFDTDGLAEDTYEATIVITSNDPDENPVNVDVTLTVSAVSVEPAITVSVSQLTSEVTVGETDSKNFTITNNGDSGSDLTYSISWQYGRFGNVMTSSKKDIPEHIWERLYATGDRDNTWLTLSPTSGNCLYNETDQITVGFDSNGMSAGTYTATISIANNATVAQTINVTFNVIGNGLPISPKAVAEFSPSQGVLIRYPFGISYSLIAELSQEINVTTIVASTSEQNTVTSNYNSNGVNMTNCDFIIAASDSYWTRDSGPFFIRESNQNISIVDFDYNRPRPNDNVLPQTVANHLGLNYYYMPVTHTGGNYMTNGMGTAASTTIVYTENTSLSNAQVDSYMNTYMGVDNHMVIEDPNNTYIDHIDCWGKFLAPNKVMIRSVHTGHAQYSDIEATANYFASQTSPYGTPYEVYRVYTSDDEPYTNSLIINNRVFVPQMGTGNDGAAISSYQNAMPGYEILGFTGSWESTDALHCRVKEISDTEMLYVEHIPMNGEYAVGSYNINATVIPYSGTTITSGYPRVYYRVDSGSWTYVTMTSVGNNEYQGIIPQQAAGSGIDYYIVAQDGSGRTENHPYIGAADAHSFSVEGQAQPAELVVNVSSVVKNMTANQTGSEIIQLSNSGIGTINYSLSLSENQAKIARSIEGSYVECSATEFTSGETVTWTFTVFNASTDTEWLKDIYIDFPTGVTVNSATNFVGGSGGDMVYDSTTGNGAYVNWHGENSSGWGLIQGNESATATVNVTISSSFTSEMTLNYQIDGDIYGADPHTVNGTMTLSPLAAPLGWISLGSASGTLTDFASQNVQLNFDSNGLTVGDYTCYLNINDNRSLTVIPITLSVIEAPNYPTWEPVTYANDPVMLYASITVNNTPAVAGDMVGAFVGEECRGTATVQVNGRASFVVMEIEMAQTNEVISFKVYANGSDAIYNADYSTTADPGETIGDSENMVPINAITNTSAPDFVGRMIEDGYVILYWEPIQEAITYRVYSSDNPFTGFTLDNTGALDLTERGITWSAPLNSASKRFYYVTVIY